MTEQTISGDDSMPPPINNAAGEWYYVENGTRKGPVTQSTIEQLLSEKKLEPDAQVWRKGMKEWISIRNSELFRLVESEPPPVSGDQINNSIVWVIALLPLVFGIIEAYMATRPEVVLARRLAMIPGSGLTEFHEREIPWQITMAINSILCLWDERRLNKAGHSEKWMTISAVLLVPVYLFLRAKKLKQRPIYAITWVAMLVLSIILVASAQS